MPEKKLEQIAQELYSLLPIFHRKLIRSCWVQTKHALSPMQLHAMFILQSKNADTMTEIAREIGISRQQMTPIIDKLITLGCIKREHDELDRRHIRLSLTETGQQYLDQHCKKKITLLEAKLQGLDDADRETLSQAIKDLHQVMDKLT